MEIFFWNVLLCLAFWFYLQFDRKTHPLVESSLCSSSQPTEALLSSKDNLPGPHRITLACVCGCRGPVSPHLTQHLTSHCLPHGSCSTLLKLSPFSSFSLPSGHPLNPSLLCHPYLWHPPKAFVSPQPSPGCGRGILGLTRLLWLPSSLYTQVLIVRLLSLFPDLSWSPALRSHLLPVSF